MSMTLAKATADVCHAVRNQDVQWLRSRLGIDEKQARHLLQDAGVNELPGLVETLAAPWPKPHRARLLEEIKLKRLLAPHHERMAQIKAAREKAAGSAVAPKAAGWLRMTG
jgi:hypothetical protein